MNYEYQYYFKSIRVVDCPEFRSFLLFLKQDLQDSDIPHRHKIRESIIVEWGAVFSDLRLQLSVRYSAYKI